MNSGLDSIQELATHYGVRIVNDATASQLDDKFVERLGRAVSSLKRHQQRVREQNHDPQICRRPREKGNRGDPA